MAWTTDALKRNRVSTLLYGGTESDRRAFAQTVTDELEASGLVEAKDAASVERALNNSRAVVYVPDVTVLPAVTQRAVVRVLREREERPKLVFGIGMSPDTALEKGLLTEDLKYWLSSSTVDVKSRARK
ncbi:MAG: hypothetical protein U0228_33265 [Myxococcaceae bacterium]